MKHTVLLHTASSYRITMSIYESDIHWLKKGIYNGMSLIQEPFTGISDLHQINHVVSWHETIEY